MVAESLIEVEEEQEAIEAELVRMNSSQSGRDNTKEPTPDSIDVMYCLLSIYSLF